MVKFVIAHSIMKDFIDISHPELMELTLQNREFFLPVPPIHSRTLILYFFVVVVLLQINTQTTWTMSFVVWQNLVWRADTHQGFPLIKDLVMCEPTVSDWSCKVRTSTFTHKVVSWKQQSDKCFLKLCSMTWDGVVCVPRMWLRLRGLLWRRSWACAAPTNRWDTETLSLTYARMHAHARAHTRTRTHTSTIYKDTRHIGLSHGLRHLISRSTAGLSRLYTHTHTHTHTHTLRWSVTWLKYRSELEQ